MTQPPRTAPGAKPPTGGAPGTSSAPASTPASSTGARPSKAEARAARIAAAKAERERQARVAKLRNLAIAIGVVLVIAIVAIVLATRAGNSSSAAAKTPAGLATTAKGVKGSLYGNASAPVKITLFEDFQCPICEQLETKNGAEFTSLADQGKIQIVYSVVSFLNSSTTTYSSHAAGAWYCAPQAQRKALHDAFYADQPAETSHGRTEAQILATAAKAGVTGAAFTSCVHANTYESFATGPQTTKLGTVSGTVSTPTMLVNGQIYAGVTTLTPATLDQVVAQAATQSAGS